MTRFRGSLFALLLAGALTPASATEIVTSVNTTTTPGTPSPAEGYTFENSVRSLDSFNTASGSYDIASVANNVFVRRNNVSLNQSSVWYDSSGTGTNLAGVHEDSYGPMLLGNTVLLGSDNTFANGTSGASIGNIERLDFTWNSGLTVSDSLAFAVFERGAAAVHDGFAIAAITAIDASGNPTAFGSLLKVASNWGDAINPVADREYRLFRYGNGDAISASTDSSGVAVQGVGGILLHASDLGLTNGSTVYGYALMAADVTATDSTQLMDWLNDTYYPTTTDGTTGGGGIDLAGFNGVSLAAVPEPSAWLAIVVIGSLFAGANLRRVRRSPSA